MNEKQMKRIEKLFDIASEEHIKFIVLSSLEEWKEMISKNDLLEIVNDDMLLMHNKLSYKWGYYKNIGNCMESYESDLHALLSCPMQLIKSEILMAIYLNSKIVERIE